MKLLKIISLLLGGISIILLMVLALALTTSPSWDALNKPFIIGITYFLIVSVITSMTLILSFNIEKFNSQEHYREIVRRYVDAATRLHKVCDKLEKEISQKIVDDICKLEKDE